MLQKLRFFGFSLTITIGVIVAVLFGMGLAAALVTILLILIEITFSFENAVINARKLQTLSKRWQALFLTVGIIIAIFGMRIVFPILIVALTANLSWHQVLDLAFNHPHEYAEKLELAHPSIAAFGGAFLMMLCLHFFFDSERETRWLDKIEKPLQRLEQNWLPAVITAATIVGLSLLPVNHHASETVRAGLLGVATYVVIKGIETAFERLQSRPSQKRGAAKAAKASKVAGLTGWAAFSTFLYLEILDASFSFDGVIGAFAVTTSVILIAAGLGVGAVWVRSLTVYMVRHHTLNRYRYLEHGAHYTVAVLAATLLLSELVDVPELVAGVAGIIFVGSAFVSSKRVSDAS